MASETPQNGEIGDKKDLDLIIQDLARYTDKPDTALITKGYYYCIDKHKNQKRKSGEPYHTHPIEVAKILVRFNLDESAVVAGLLHDVVEDTNISLKTIQEEFSQEIAELVDGVTKLSQLNFISHEAKLAENFRKMILAMSKDIRVILIKLADRTHNMQTLSHMIPAKQRSIAKETLDIYAPLANRLGMFWIKAQLEDLSLRYLKPDIYYSLVTKINQRKVDRERFVSEVQQIIEGKITPLNFKYQISGRSKHFYSIFKKMMHRNIEFEEVQDLFAFRIIVNTVSECYEVLGLLHSIWKPVPGRFKDYIAMPKMNNYQSLHTTVIGPMGEKIEFQIRTNIMHEVCEYGIAAHWVYKENRSKINAKELDNFRWIKQMVQWRDELHDPNEFLESVKVDLFENVVYCFTPRGDVYELPADSTPIDFAFQIHTEVGLRCVGVKVNNRMVPLKTILKSGDTVEIITSKNQKPSKDWLKYAVTAKAKNKIRSSLKQEERDKSLKMGQEMLSKEFNKFNYTLEEYIKSGELKRVSKSYQCHDLEDLYTKIGYGKVRIVDFFERLFTVEEYRRLKREFNTSTTPIKNVDTSKIPASDIRVDDLDEVLVKFAQCCNPLPGEDIVGFITRGHGVTVHRTNCPWAMAIDPERLVTVAWNNQIKGTHATSLRIITIDKPGILASVTKVISLSEFNILKADIVSTGIGQGILNFTLNIRSLDELEKLITNIEKVNGIISVQRVYK